GDLAEMLRGGTDPAGVHPALPSLRYNSPPVWNGGEQYVLRVLSGDERGSILWVKPADLQAPIRIGRRGVEPRPDIDLSDSKAGAAAVEFAGNRVLLRNED